jgi:Ca2+-binding EF-hand superfamily protein
MSAWAQKRLREVSSLVERSSMTLRATFDIYDTNNNGYLSRAEFSNLLRALGTDARTELSPDDAGTTDSTPSPLLHYLGTLLNACICCR